MRKIHALNFAAATALVGILLISGCHSGGMGGSTNEMFEAAKLNDTAKIDQLVSSSTNVDERGPHARTPLAIAIINGHLDTAEKLLKAGADPAAADDKGITPLMWAASRGNTDLLHKMVAKHPPLDAQDRRGFTAVYQAADQGHVDAYKVLADAGANVNLRDKKGRSAEDILRIKGLSSAASRPSH